MAPVCYIVSILLNYSRTDMTTNKNNNLTFNEITEILEEEIELYEREVACEELDFDGA